MRDTSQVPGGLPNARWSCEEFDVQVGGLRLHVLDAKQRSGAPGPRPLLMLHGMTSHGDAWRPVIASLSSVGRALCPDFRGHGQSDWTTAGYWLNDYAKDIIGLLNALEIDDVDVIGQSLGARVAMVLGKHLGPRLHAMILCDTGPEVGRDAAQQARSVFLDSKSKTAFNSEDELKQFLREVQPEWAEVSIDVRAARLFRENWAGKLVNRGDPDVGWLLGRAGLRERDDMWEGLKTTPAAVLVLRGEHSYLLDEELADRMSNAAANGTHLALPFGHYIPYEAPDVLASVIDQYLAQRA